MLGCIPNPEPFLDDLVRLPVASVPEMVCEHGKFTGRQGLREHPTGDFLDLANFQSNHTEVLPWLDFLLDVDLINLPQDSMPDLLTPLYEFLP